MPTTACLPGWHQSGCSEFISRADYSFCILASLSYVSLGFIHLELFNWRFCILFWIVVQLSILQPILHHFSFILSLNSVIYRSNREHDGASIVIVETELLEFWTPKRGTSALTKWVHRFIRLIYDCRSCLVNGRWGSEATGKTDLTFKKLSLVWMKSHGGFLLACYDLY